MGRLEPVHHLVDRQGRSRRGTEQSDGAAGWQGNDLQAPSHRCHEASTFEWLGKLGVTGVFDGRHRFQLEATPSGGTHLVHTEHFTGVLVRFMRKSLDTNTVQGFELMDTALKNRVEATS